MNIPVYIIYNPDIINITITIQVEVIHKGVFIIKGSLKPFKGFGLLE